MSTYRCIYCRYDKIVNKQGIVCHRIVDYTCSAFMNTTMADLAGFPESNTPLILILSR